jgi:hypothetical protein
MCIPDVLHLFPCAQQDDIQLSSNQFTDQLHVAESSKSTSSQLVKKFPHFVEQEVSLQRSLEPTASPYIEPNT